MAQKNDLMHSLTELREMINSEYLDSKIQINQKLDTIELLAQISDMSQTLKKCPKCNKTGYLFSKKDIIAGSIPTSWRGYIYFCVNCKEFSYDGVNR